MLVAVGSTNRCKIEGVRRAYSKYFRDFKVVAVKVDPGVSAQPLSLEETFRGAYNRGFHALRNVDGDHGVGVEAGMFTVGGLWFDIQVAAIVDRSLEVTYGLSSSFAVPGWIADKLVEGKYKELEPVVEGIYGVKDIGEKGGFVSMLTQNTVSREDLSYQATLMALIPRLKHNLKLYGRT